MHKQSLCSAKFLSPWRPSVASSSVVHYYSWRQPHFHNLICSAVANAPADRPTDRALLSSDRPASSRKKAIQFPCFLLSSSSFFSFVLLYSIRFPRPDWLHSPYSQSVSQSAGRANGRMPEGTHVGIYAHSWNGQEKQRKGGHAVNNVLRFGQSCTAY